MNIREESTTNTLSPGFISDGEGRHHFFRREKNVALCSPLASGFALPASTLLREPDALATLSPPETDPQIWSVGAALMSFSWATSVERWFVVSFSGIAQYGFSESNTSGWFRHG